MFLPALSIPEGTDIMGGWIKLHRDILKNSLWLDCTLEQKVIMITLLLMANHEERKCSFGKDIITIMPGQFVTSIKSIAQNCGNGITERQIRTALDKFEKRGFVVKNTSNKNTLVSIVNWGVYQDIGALNVKQMSNKCKTDVKQMSTNKNEKNEKNEKKIYKESVYNNIYNNTRANTECPQRDKGVPKSTEGMGKVFVPPSVEQVREYCRERGNNIDPERFVSYYETSGWMRGKNKVKDWRALVRTWERNDNTFKAAENTKKNKFINYEQKTYTDSEWEEILARKARELEE